MTDSLQWPRQLRRSRFAGLLRLPREPAAYSTALQLHTSFHPTSSQIFFWKHCFSLNQAEWRGELSQMKVSVTAFCQNFVQIGPILVIFRPFEIFRAIWINSSDVDIGWCSVMPCIMTACKQKPCYKPLSVLLIMKLTNVMFEHLAPWNT